MDTFEFTQMANVILYTSCAYVRVKKQDVCMYVPWAIQHLYPGKLMFQVMLATVVAIGTEIKVIASDTLPSNASDTIFPAHVTHD